MRIIDNSPAAVAKNLVEDNYTVEQMERLQQHRKGRVEFWKDKNQPEILKENEEIFAHGEEVLKFMKEEYASQKRILD